MLLIVIGIAPVFSAIRAALYKSAAITSGIYLRLMLLPAPATAVASTVAALSPQRHLSMLPTGNNWQQLTVAAA
ncbi:hypothetical protein [Herbaspirillum rubrisubalbicans]|uniref:Uncharacterized protein n=1 Tax=Herbaspirillum rubrisubalbicans TaxID=80842 RepID=A0AAD0UAG4_9BURK|nr:hypothetical protein [Herbaspirillum rubrisubalbicans]AYR25980.1 hypothetical protein RC54_20140 [Herbaspirillum rubrisubalbicans]